MVNVVRYSCGLHSKVIDFSLTSLIGVSEAELDKKIAAKTLIDNVIH